MKGMVFTEFLEMVESVFGWEIVEEILADAEQPSGGAYTSVGSYDHRELVALVQALSIRSGRDVSELLQTYGHYLFGRFATLYPRLFEGDHDVFSFVAAIDNYIHVEVRKLYPDAQLPSFVTVHDHDLQMTLDYRSERPFADFAHGLLLGCIAHFGESIVVERQDTGHGGTGARFILRYETHRERD